MAKAKKRNKSKRSVKVEDISPKGNVVGGKEQKVDGSLGGSVKIGYDWGRQIKG